MCCSKFFLGLGYILLLLCVAFYVIFAALAIVINLDVVQQQVSAILVARRPPSDSPKIPCGILLDSLDIATNLEIVQQQVKSFTSTCVELAHPLPHPPPLTPSPTLTQVKIFISVCETTMPPLNQKLTDIRSALARAEVQGMNVTEYEAQVALYEPAALTFNAMCSCIDELLSSFTGLFLPGILTTCAIIYLYVATITMCCSAKCCAAPLVTGDGGAPVISKPSFHDVSDITSV